MSLQHDHERNRPRVVHLTTAHPADDVRIFERECRSLAATGKYEVILAASGSIPAGSGVTFVPLAAAPSTRLGRFSTSPRKAFALARALSADIWHFHDPELLPVAYRLARSGRRVIWDAHEDYEGQFTEEGGKSWVPGIARGMVRAGTGFLLRAVDQYAAGVIAATPTIASRYRNPRTTVVGNEARLELFTGCTPNLDSRQVLFTGTPGPGHLFQEVVEAVAKLQDVQLLVAGREPDQVVWRAAADLLGARLTHAGWLDRDGVANAVSNSAVGLSTYADLRTNSENSPNKLFEFGAAGLPVVASPTASNARYLAASQAGVVASDFSAGALSAAIAEVLSSREKWIAASVAGRTWAAKEGSWTTSEERLLRLYESVVFNYGRAGMQ